MIDCRMEIFKCRWYFEPRPIADPCCATSARMCIHKQINVDMQRGGGSARQASHEFPLRQLLLSQGDRDAGQEVDEREDPDC